MTPDPIRRADATEPLDEETVGPRIYGVVDVLRHDRIAGWAIDRADSAASLDIDILRDGRLVCTVRADRRRPDLEKGGVGSGAYGFRAEIAPPLEPGFEFTLEAVARAPDGSRAELRRVGAAVRTPDPATRLLERIYEGVTRPPAVPAPAPTAEVVERLSQIVARIETAQIRIEAALAGVEPPPPPAADRGLRALVWAAVAVASLSLGLGVLSFWAP